MIREGLAVLLAEAGLARPRTAFMRKTQAGEPMRFEFLAVNRQQERLALNFAPTR